MASSNGAGAGVVQAKLGLVGATMNAMALIAPGAFLWITYQLQAAATAPSGAVVANDMWMGIVLALVVCFLTALSYSQLAKIYPEAGFASCAYFAEKAWLDAKGEKRSGPKSAARISKLATGWSAHLFYWAYSGVMAAMMATMIGYIYNQFTGHDLSIVNMAIICVRLHHHHRLHRLPRGDRLDHDRHRASTSSSGAPSSSSLASRSGTVSPTPSTSAHWAFSGGLDIIKPHMFSGVLVQSTIAILILVGFESCTALSAETKNAGKNIPKAIIISLVVQGVFAYLIEYFAASYMVSDKLINVTNKVTTTGLAAAAASSAPIGDLVQLLGNNLIPGIRLRSHDHHGGDRGHRHHRHDLIRHEHGHAHHRRHSGFPRITLGLELHSSRVQDPPHGSRRPRGRGLGDRHYRRAERRWLDGHRPCLEPRDLHPLRSDVRVDDHRL